MISAPIMTSEFKMGSSRVIKLNSNSKVSIPILGCSSNSKVVV